MVVCDVMNWNWDQKIDKFYDLLKTLFKQRPRVNIILFFIYVIGTIHGRYIDLIDLWRKFKTTALYTLILLNIHYFVTLPVSSVWKLLNFYLLSRVWGLFRKIFPATSNFVILFFFHFTSMPGFFLFLLRKFKRWLWNCSIDGIYGFYRKVHAYIFFNHLKKRVAARVYIWRNFITKCFLFYFYKFRCDIQTPFVLFGRCQCRSIF